MRVRRFELRLIGSALVACWAVAAGLILLAYRPGGPFDVIVGILAMVPIGIALAGVIWPPVTRGDRSFPAMVWLGIGALLFLFPSIKGILDQLVALGSQTLLPSLESAYPWVLALLATSLFSGFGMARRMDGGDAPRRRRLAGGTAIAVVATVLSGAAFVTVAVANDIMLRDATASASRFGPTTGSDQPPMCDVALAAGATARVDLRLAASVDLRPIGTVELSGLRVGSDFRWQAYVASTSELGRYGMARSGDRAWLLQPGGRWRPAVAATGTQDTVDVRALEAALTPDYRATAEDRGVEVIEGARARRCRIAIDGPVFAAAFPQVRWLIGPADLHRWRGQLDYWVFLDGQLGQVTGSVNGEAAGLVPEALQGTVEVRLTATERGADFVIYPPAQ